jgi:hypothetical protein
VAVVALCLPAVPGAAEGSLTDVSARRSLEAGVLVTRHGITVQVPLPGYRVARSMLLASGGERSLVVTTRASGAVVVQDVSGVDEEMVPARATGPCNDRAHRIGRPWRTSYEWWFRPKTVPRGLDRDRVLAHIRRSVRNITDARNDCGRRDRVHARAAYKGITTAKPQPCSFGPNRSIVFFEPLPPGVLGQTEGCWSFEGDPGAWVAVQAHVSLNNRYRWTTRKRGCRGRFLVEAVATHEFGHAFGLLHVSESRHPWHTMSSVTHPCDNSESTLGLGDMIGLEKLYPA